MRYICTFPESSLRIFPFSQGERPRGLSLAGFLKSPPLP
jgi:hypothetical protein